MGRFTGLTLCIPLAVACAHRPSAEESSAAFRELQEHEAELARAEAERGRWLEQVCEPPMHDATERVCAESRALCALSSELHDRDAEARCLRGQDTCRAAREHIQARCATQAR